MQAECWDRERRKKAHLAAALALFHLQEESDGSNKAGED